LKLIKENLYEKFTDDTDAIGDMGIGANHFKEKIMKLFPAKYERAGVDYVDYIRYVLFGDETTIEYDKNAQGNTMYTIICNEYSKKKFFDTIEYMIQENGYVNDKGVAVDAITKKGNKMNIVMADAHVNEKFSEESDPVKDMGIGSGWRTIALYGMTNFKKDVFDPKENEIISIEGHDVGDFFKKSGVTYTMKDEYKSGIAGLIFTGSEKNLLYILSHFYDVDENRAKDNNWIRKVKMNEAFSDESDPIKDMHIGTIKVIQNYADKKVKDGDASWGSGPMGWLWEIDNDPDLDEKTKKDWLKVINDHFGERIRELQIRNAAARGIPKKLRVRESFSEESDPIKDMGIGLRVPRDFPSDEKMLEFVADNIPGILERTSIPTVFIMVNKDYDHASMKSYLKSKIDDYVQKYLTVLGQKRFDAGVFDLAKKLKSGVRISTKDELDNDRTLLTK
jgi:hypothetical protein